MPDSTPLTTLKRRFPSHGSCAGPLGERSPATSLTTSLFVVATALPKRSRGSGSGQVIYGPHNGAGAVAVSFDSPARNFCSVVANGNDGTSGQDVYDHWFRDAPLCGSPCGYALLG